MKKITLLICLMLLSCIGLNAQTITIGTGTSTQRFPLGSYFGFERSAAIYTAAEIGSAGNIVSLAWEATSAGTARPVIIYLMETPSSTLTSDTWANQIAGATQVYSGVLNPVVGWNTFNLPLPYSYSGGANNLMVLVEANYGGSGGTGSAGNSVKYTTAASQHEYWQQDGSVPLGTGIITDNRPNIQITLGSACTGTPVAGSVAPAIQNLCSGATPANLTGTGYSTGVLGLTFQWEESNDNGAADAWAPVVGGSGATSPTYTPPAFSGTTIYYRLNVTCSNSGMSAQTASVLVTTPVNPSTQVTNVLLSGIGSAQATANWTNGNGYRRVVFVSNSATFTDPVNGNGPALVANTVYSGSGQQLIYDGTGTTVTVTGLSAATQYYIKAYEYVQCGSGPYDYYYNTATGTNIGNFTTCGVANIPYVQDFESVTTPAIPNCTSVVNDGTGNVWDTANAPGYGFTTNALRYVYNGTNPANTWFFTQGINLTAGTSYRISYNYGNNSTYYIEKLKVAYGTSATSAAMTNVLADHPNINQNTIQFNQVDFTPSATGVYNFGFQAYSTTDQFYLFVDDINITVTPACSAPINLATSNLNDNSATISWGVIASASGYQYVLDTNASDPAGAGTDIAANSYNAGSLAPSTTYYFHVRSVCAGPIYSGWSTISFTTLPTPPANDNCSTASVLTPGGVFANNPLAVNLTGATNSTPPAPGCASFQGNDVWYRVTIPASGTLTVETNNDGSGNYDTGMAVYSGTCGSLTLIECDDDDSLDGAYSLINLTRTPGEVVYVNTWRYNGGPAITYRISAYDASLSAGSFDVASFKAYPNPVKDVLNLSYSTEISSVEVYNMLGQKVLVKTLNVAQGQIDMSNLNSGNYIVKVTADGLTKTIKVVKQ
ncbi:MAG TPA: T9SS type A sorting domain-containing protein [Flavobacterium sp.]|uniref:T9SS type A sorting domain-containing protein n=1 Tax=Flavobacterium sp. TaxID=239 RepID=UPI002CBA5962|nr:T9SS type A sorting domain-containing protein [Flavobacterium sp.]HSD13703.1 T9SS type A sorting domain-containing protein [Flavobacterium sp.]